MRTWPASVPTTGISDALAGLTDFDGMTATAVYAVLFGLIFVESGLLVGFALPGDSVLFAAGLLAAHQGSGPRLSLPVLCVGALLAAVAGDAVGYWTGRRFGRPWVLQRAGRLARHVPRAEEFYDRYGWGAVVVSRFIPWVRTFTPIVAGVARMPYPRFLSANIVGALTWAVGLIVLGWAAYGLPWLRWAAYAVAGAAILGSLAVAVLGARRRRRGGDASTGGEGTAD